MSFFDWFLDPVKNHYADFEGRATRKQFWMFILVSILISIGISLVEEIIGVMALSALFSLAILIPNIAITARRLHDTNRSGWWQLILLVPVIGLIVLIVWLAGESKNEGNAYDDNAPATPDATNESTVPVQEPQAEVASTEAKTENPVS